MKAENMIGSFYERNFMIEIRPKTDTRVSPRTKLMGRIKLANLFSLPEEEFEGYLKQIEEREEFKELLRYRVIKFNRFSGIRSSPSVQFREELSSGGNFSLEEVMEKDPKGWQVVKKVATTLGKDKFSNFLKEGRLSLKEIAKECALSAEETKKFTNFMNRFQVYQIFFNSDASGSESISSASHFSRVAYIENQDGKLFIFPANNSGYLGKGRYTVDYERWESLIKDKELSSNKVRKIMSLFRQLDMINNRITTIYGIIHQIKERQSSFLISGDPKDKVPLTQRQMAQILGVDPSTISRSIANKSIVSPRGKEMSLKSFFTTGKEKINALIMDILKEERRKLMKGLLSAPLSDEKIKDRLKEKYGIKIARRTIAKYRKEILEIPSSRERKNPDEHLA